MIVCHCAAVSDTTIDRLIRDGAGTVEEITRQCGAGRCCEPCREEIREMLYASRPVHYTQAETRAEKLAAA